MLTTTTKVGHACLTDFGLSKESVSTYATEGWNPRLAD